MHCNAMCNYTHVASSLQAPSSRFVIEQAQRDDATWSYTIILRAE